MDLAQRLCSFNPRGNVLPASAFSFFSDLSSPPSGVHLPEKTKALILSKGERFLEKDPPILPPGSIWRFTGTETALDMKRLYFQRREGLFFLSLSHWIEGGQRFLTQNC